MPRIIFKCPYIKPGTERAAAHLNNYVRYVATRDGTDLLKPDKAGQPATKKQRAMVERLLRDFPMCRGMFEYEDYQSSPTRATASEFITRAIEDNYDQIAKRENYVSYIAQRPRAERLGAHGLFNGTGTTLELSRRRWRTTPATCGCPSSPCVGRTLTGSATTTPDSGRPSSPPTPHRLRMP